MASVGDPTLEVELEQEQETRKVRCGLETRGITFSSEHTENQMEVFLEQILLFLSEFASASDLPSSGLFVPDVGDDSCQFEDWRKTTKVAIQE